MIAGVVADDAALRALRPDWDALWRRAVGVTPFHSPAWLLAWWDAFGTGMPRVATLRDAAGRLLGLLPLYLLPEDGSAKLLLMGVGVSDYLDALLDPEAPAEAPGWLLAAALDASGDAASCDLTDLPPGAALREAPVPAGWRDEGVHPTDPCPVLALAPGATLAGSLPKGRRDALRNARNRAREGGGWTLETATPDTAGAMLDALVALHGGRWAGQGKPGGVLADPRVLALHREATPALVADGSLRLQLLRLGGVPAAAHHAFLAADGTVLLYLSGYDAARARESPGAILLGELIASMLAEGRRELHFLRGPEAYKYAWGAVDRHNASRRLRPDAARRTRPDAPPPPRPAGNAPP